MGSRSGLPPVSSTLLLCHPSDELYQELRQHFSEEQLIELAATAALENFRARYNRVFDVGSDGLYRKGLRFKQR